MSSITHAEALRRLREALDGMAPADLREVHNDLFPPPRLTVEEVAADPERVASRVAKRIDRGLAIDTTIALWPVVFSGGSRLFYDEDTGEFELVDRAEPVEWVEG